MQLQHIELSRLSVSKANMRDGRKLPDIRDILPSVKARGVLVPVLVRPNGSADSFEIVAGRRRYYAALAAGEGQDAPAPLPCAILDENDDAAALEASLIENVIRADPDEVTKWETFSKLIAKGRTVEDIAATFGMAELVVKRVLALGNLLPRIRDAYRAEQIDAATVRHLTLASKAQQKAWVALFDDPDGYAPRGQQLKAWLFGGASIATAVALFDLAAFSGVVVNDLFGEGGYFADADQFWAAQTAEIERRKAAYLEDGWSGVEIAPRSSCFHVWEHEKTAKRKGGRVFIDIDAKGAVVFHEGYLTRKEARVRASGGHTAKPPAPPRPEITSAMTDYVDLHRHAAVGAALAAQPHVALRVMVVHAICGSPLWTVRVQSPTVRNEAVSASVAKCVGHDRLAERRRAVLGLLGFDPEGPSVTMGHEPRCGVTGLLQRLLELPDTAVLDVLAVVIAESLASGSMLIETLGVTLGVDMAEMWVADDAFYGLVRDREVLTALLAEVGGDAAAAANATEKTKVIKGVISDCLTGENGRAKVEKWVPRWMAFPPAAYTERGGVATVAAAKRAAWLAEAEPPVEADAEPEPEPAVEADVAAEAKMEAAHDPDPAAPVALTAECGEFDGDAGGDGGVALATAEAGGGSDAPACNDPSACGEAAEAEVEDECLAA